MIRRFLLSAVLTLVTLAATAQVNDKSEAQPQLLRFGYLNFDSALVCMPGYHQAQLELQALREAYEQEMKRVEDDFNTKYEAFLEGQAEFPRTILLKRQQELQDMLQQNIAFKNKCQQELAQKEAETQNHYRDIVRQVVSAQAKSLHLAFVLNTASDACPYLDAEQGIDLQDAVEEALFKGVQELQE